MREFSFKRLNVDEIMADSIIVGELLGEGKFTQVNACKVKGGRRKRLALKTLKAPLNNEHSRSKPEPASTRYLHVLVAERYTMKSGT
jgi:hypothetical protein